MGVLSLLSLVWGAAPVNAVEYGGFGGRPAFPRQDNPRTESIFVHTLEPGDTQKEGVQVVNNSSSPKTVWVYATDSARSSDGAFACAQQSETREGVGAWITLEESQITLQPGENKVIPFTIRVPQTASAGEQNGCILIQEKKEKDENATGMSLSFRMGLRVAITIPGELHRSVEIVGLQVSKQDRGEIVFHPALRNTGNVSVDADVKIVASTLIGTELAVKGGTYPILRGETSEWNFEIPKPFWGGWYRATMSVQYDGDEGASLGVDSGKEKNILNGPTVWFFSSPTWPAVGIELGVLVGLLLWIRAWMRSRELNRWIEKTWVNYPVESGETIVLLAERYGIPWKILATANRLKPPYALTPGQTLRVPPRTKSEVMDLSNGSSPAS